MHIDLMAFGHWLSQPTPEAFLACVVLCLLPVFGAPLAPGFFRSTIVRGAILALWERDIRIWEMRQRFERGGIITEPVTTHDCHCQRCKTGYSISLECDLMRPKPPFTGIITRCASCGQTPDMSPGETLDELAIRFKLAPNAA